MAAQIKVVESSIQHKLNSLPKSPSNVCIYKVPEHLRKINRECYQPSIVSIGPIYYQKPYLKHSQELKLIHVKFFLHYCNRANSLGQIIEYMTEWEHEARSYYEENIGLSSNEFVEMMMIDATFIIYFFLCYCQSDNPLHHLEVPIEKKRSWMKKVEEDVFVEDNQLPFFVLERVYNIAFGSIYPGDITFKDLTCSFIHRACMLGSAAADTRESRERVTKTEIKHLVDLLRVCCLPITCPTNQYLENNNENGLPLSCLLPLLCRKGKQKNKDLPPTAKQLLDSGVKFEADESKNLLNITFSAKGVLKIPTLTIVDTTEAILRNIVFFELCHHTSPYKHFIDYVIFLDELINTLEDVQILVKHGIVDNCLGSDEEVATMVNRIATHNLQS